MPGYGQRVLGVALKAQMQRLDALQEQKRIKRRKRRAGIPQSLHSRLQNECQRPECLGIAKPVVRRVGLRELLEAARRRPVELARVHNHAADGRSMATQEFGG